jgi:glycosyltransferase 2 family protein
MRNYLEEWYRKLTPIVDKIRVWSVQYTWIRTSLTLIVLGLVVVFFARQFYRNFIQARELWQPVRACYLGCAFLTLIGCFFILAYAWHGILRALGGKLSLRKALYLYAITLLPRYVPGMVWGYAGRTVLCEKEGTSHPIAIGSTVVEVGLIIGSGVIFVALYYTSPIWMGGILVGIAVGLYLAKTFADYYDADTFLPFIRIILRWYGWGMIYLGFWFLYGFSVWLVVIAVIPTLDGSYFMQVAASATIAWIAGFLVIVVPGGLGIREGVLLLTLTSIVGAEARVFIPWVVRLLNMGAEAAFLFLVILFYNFVLRKL